MAETPRSSFIPKQSSGAVPTRVKKKRRFGAITYTGNAILIVSLLVALGTWFYKDYSEQELENTKVALERERSQFNEAELERVREFDYQFSVVRLLLDHHISPSKIFDTLELTTKESVQFMNFSFVQQPSQDVELSLQGGTEAFKTVALQALTYGDDPLMTDAVITGLSNTVPNVDDVDSANSQTEEHDVSFSVEGSISGDRLMYDGLGFVEVSEELDESEPEQEQESDEQSTDTEEEEAGGENEDVPSEEVTEEGNENEE